MLIGKRHQLLTEELWVHYKFQPVFFKQNNMSQKKLKRKSRKKLFLQFCLFIFSKLSMMETRCVCGKKKKKKVVSSNVERRTSNDVLTTHEHHRRLRCCRRRCHCWCCCYTSRTQKIGNCDLEVQRKENKFK